MNSAYCGAFLNVPLQRRERMPALLFMLFSPPTSSPTTEHHHKQCITVPRRPATPWSDEPLCVGREPLMYSNRVFLIQLSDDAHVHARSHTLSLLGHYLWSYSFQYAAIITALPIIRALQLPIIILLCFLWGPFLFHREKKKKTGKRET